MVLGALVFGFQVKSRSKVSVSVVVSDVSVLSVCCCREYGSLVSRGRCAVVVLCVVEELLGSLLPKRREYARPALRGSCDWPSAAVVTNPEVSS